MFSLPFPSSISILSLLLKGATWTIPNKDNKIYLTFDDGPIPEVTPWVLDLLQEKNIKATFFCLGKNVEAYPDIYRAVGDQGHSIGNHSYSHLNGWLTEQEEYLTDVKKAEAHINSNLYRPPYGKITPMQWYDLRKKYKIIMWDVLSKDYDRGIDAAEVYHNVITQVRSGSIVVMHDSLKAKENLMGSLEKIVDALLNKGYTFGKLPYNNLDLHTF